VRQRYGRVHGVVVGVVTYRDLIRALARDDALVRADVQRRLDIYGGVGGRRARVRDGEVTIADDRGSPAAAATLSTQGVRGSLLY
jgi:CBS domain-containing protein